MAIISIGSPESKILVEYPIAVHQAHEGAPTRILVPTNEDLRQLNQKLHKAGTGNPGWIHTLKPDDFMSFHYIGADFQGLIAQVFPLIVYKETSELLTGVNANLIMTSFMLV